MNLFLEIAEGILKKLFDGTLGEIFEGSVKVDSEETLEEFSERTHEDISEETPDEILEHIKKDPKKLSEKFLDTAEILEEITKRIAKGAFVDTF